jgi:hypothetical protein
MNGRLGAVLLVCLSAMLGGCSPFAGFVADHWPHVAGGEPNGLPPRPGTPGYAAFIAHGQGEKTADSPGADGQQNGNAEPGMAAKPGSLPPPQQAPVANARAPLVPNDDSVQRGLY